MNGPTVGQIEMLSFCPAHKGCFWLTVRLPKKAASAGGWKFVSLGKWHGSAGQSAGQYYMVFYGGLTLPTSDYIAWRQTLTQGVMPWSACESDPREAALVVLAKAIELAAFSAGPVSVDAEREVWNLSVSGFEQLGVYIHNLFDVKEGKAIDVPELSVGTGAGYDSIAEVPPDGLYPHTIVPKNVRMPNRACQCEHYLNSHGIREEGGRWMCFVMTCNCESYRYRCPECNQISQRGMRHRVDCRTGQEHENAFRQLMGEPIQPALRLGIALEIAEP